MLIDKKKLMEIANTTLKLIDDKKINSLDDLEKWVGHKFVPDSKKKEEYIEISEIPSNCGTTLSVSYISHMHLGIPLEILINRRLNYSRIILKFNRLLEQYSPFMYDTYGNTIQERNLPTIDFQEVRKQL